MNGEVKGLPQPPDRRPIFNPKKRGNFGKLKVRKPRGKKQPFKPKRRGFFGKIKVKPRAFGPKYNRRLAGVSGAGRQYGPKYLKRKAGGGAAPGAVRRGKRKAGRGGGRRSSSSGSWLLKMAKRAAARHLKRVMRSTAPRDYRNHGYKGIKKRGRTGLGGR